MITDPENKDEQPYQYDEPILASSLEDAIRICRIKAQRDGVKLIQIKQPAKIRQVKTSSTDACLKQTLLNEMRYR